MAVWDYRKLSPAGKAMWDGVAFSAEDNFFIWAKHICDLDWLEGYIHEPLCRFMSAPVLGSSMPDALIAETDWIPTDAPIERGHMKAGDPFGDPFNRQTRLSDPPKLRQLINICRGSFKTSLVGAFILWLLRRDVNKSVMVMAADDDAANKILGYCNRHIETNPKMAWFWGMNKWPGHDQWTIGRKFIATRTVNRANDPSIWSTSPGSIKAGPHPDYVFIDDIINEKVLESDEALVKANNAFDYISPMLMETSMLWVLGTPWTMADLYYSLMRRSLGTKKDYMFDIYIRDVLNPDGTFWWPERMSEKFLKSKWIEAQESSPPKPWLFWSQYRMQPVTEAENSLMLEKIDWVMQDEVDKMMPKLRKLGGVDPADEKASSGSWALWAFGTDSDKGFWDLDLQKCSAKHDMVSEIVRFAVLWHLEVLIIENTVISRRLIDSVREKLRERGVRCAVVTVEPHSMSKSRRIMEVENGFGGVMAQGRLHLRDNNHNIKMELRTFPGGTYTYDGLDIGSYITAWAASNGFYPRKTTPVVRSTLDPWLAKHRAECMAALAERDRKERGDFVPEYEEPGMVSYV